MNVVIYSSSAPIAIKVAPRFLNLGGEAERTWDIKLTEGSCVQIDCAIVASW